MSNLARVFDYSEAYRVRTEMVNGEVFFVAKDVCDILEIGNPSQALTRLDADEKGLITVDTLGGKQELAAVNEAGLYNLIFTSRKDEAKQFKKWVTNDVLPQIRRTGTYTQQPMAIEDILITALQGLKQIREENLKLREANSETQQEVHRLAVVVDNEVWLTDHQKAQIQEAVKYRCGFLKRQGYAATFQALYSALKTHFTVPKYDKIKRKDFDHALDYIRGWYPPKR